MIRSARSRSVTLTAAAEQELRQAIIEGTFSPGSQLPAETALVEMLGVSRTVVREALRGLEEDGWITRRHGVGTFVRKHPILKNLNLNFGTTEMIRSAGMAPGTQHLDIRVNAAADDVAKVLNVPLGTPVVTIERVRTADRRPVVYSLDFVPQALIGDADLASIWDGRDMSLYQLLQTQFGQVIEYGVARLLPVNAPARVAEMLGVPNDSVLQYLLQTDYSPLDEPVVYSREYHLPDAFDFMILRRGPISLGNAPAESARQ